jgi:hypothetical protein
LRRRAGCFKLFNHQSARAKCGGDVA